MSDYISREAAIIQLSHNKSRGDDEWMLAVESDMGVIKALPAADVVPVIHGTWERHMSFGICDQCGYEYNWTGTDAKNFCPNCGAKMDGGEEHEAD